MQDWIQWEQRFLAPWATHAAATAGRAVPETEDTLRTPFQRDRDRILHCKAFRRLKHKTQVFIDPKNDHFRTRLTHTLEVAQISRTVSRALALNEDLTEAIALGHDLGHTPFGHAGERALAQVMPGFSHNAQSLRVVSLLEHHGRGLNLTAETRNGILHHSGSGQPSTPEGWVVRLSDRVAYLNHDIDDAISSGYLHYKDIPRDLRDYLGDRKSARINTMVWDMVTESDGSPRVAMSAECQQVCDALREFMFQRVYFHEKKVKEEQRLGAMIQEMYCFLLQDPGLLPPEYHREPLDQAVCDYISGMTDNFALDFYRSIKK